MNIQRYLFCNHVTFIWKLPLYHINRHINNSFSSHSKCIWLEDCMSQDMELGDQKNGKHKTNGHAKEKKTPEQPGWYNSKGLKKESIHYNIYFSLWRRSWNFCPLYNWPFITSCCCLFAAIPLLCGQSCTGTSNAIHISLYGIFLLKRSMSVQSYLDLVVFYLVELEDQEFSS